MADVLTPESARASGPAASGSGVADAESSAWPRRLFVTVVFIAVTAVLLRPTPYDLNHTLTNMGDPAIVGWALSWNSHALATHPTGVFQAPIFWPNPDTLAYTDTLLLLAPPFALIRALGGSWELGVNLLTITLLFLSLVITYSLVRRLTARTDAAILAAVAFTYSSYSLGHYGHLHLLLLGQFSLGFLLTFKLLEEPRWQTALWLGLLNVSFCLGSLYYALAWAVCLGTVLVIRLVTRRARLGAAMWRSLVVMGLVSLLAAPVFIPYVRLGKDRPLVPEWGFKAGDLVTVPSGSVLYPGLDEWASGRATRFEHAFFPGFSTAALAVGGGVVLVAATVAARRRRRSADGAAAEITAADRRRNEVWLLLAAVVPTSIIALGAETHGITMPFTWLHDHVPGFGGIRIAARFAIPALLAGCALAAVGYTWIAERLRPRVAVAVATVLLAFLVLEQVGDITHVPVDDRPRTLAVYRALHRQPDGAVAELPMESPAATDGGMQWAIVEATRMLYSTLDFHPRVNGQSGGWPDDYFDTIDAVNTFPAPRALAKLRKLRVRYLVLHTAPVSGFPQYTEAQAQSIVDQLPNGASARRYGDSWLVDLGPRADDS